jgi:hypothetical protein
VSPLTGNWIGVSAIPQVTQVLPLDQIRYIVRPRHEPGRGNFSVLADSPREALDLAKGMAERGVEEVEILDENGAVIDPADLERLSRENPET